MAQIFVGIAYLSYFIPWEKMMRDVLFLGSKLLWGLTLPAVVVYVVNYIMSIATQIFSSHLGNLELTAASLGNNKISNLPLS